MDFPGFRWILMDFGDCPVAHACSPGELVHEGVQEGLGGPPLNNPLVNVALPHLTALLELLPGCFATTSSPGIPGALE